jgi:hypothetical protein
MKKNIGSTDKMVRIVAGVILILVLLFVQTGFRWVGLLGIVMLGTAFLGSCPLYLPFGINTKEHK